MGYKVPKAIEVAELVDFLKTHTNKQAAEHFGVSEKTIARRRKQHNLDHINLRYPSDLTDEQRICVLAGLLGDGSIPANHTRFAIKQKSTRKEYVEWLYDKLSPFSIYLKQTHSKLKGKKYCAWQLLTCTHPVFRTLREQWYRGQQKIVPRSLTLTPSMLAHWHVQDGCNNQGKKAITLSTNCFLVEDVLFLIDLLEKDLSIKSTLNIHNNKPTIHIGAFEYEKVISMLLPHIPWDCFKYKIDTAKAPSKKNPKLGAGKLNFELATEIRNQYNNGVEVSILSDLYDVTVGSIYNVLNYRTYKPKTSTYATVNVIYNNS